MSKTTLNLSYGRGVFAVCFSGTEATTIATGGLVNNIDPKICLVLFLFYVSQLPVPAYKWQPRPRLVKIFTGQYWWIKTQLVYQKLKPFVILRFSLYLFFHCRYWKKYNLQMLTRFLCCDGLFIWVLVEKCVETVVSSMAVFVRTFMQAFTTQQRNGQKTKAFLTWVAY